MDWDSPRRALLAYAGNTSVCFSQALHEKQLKFEGETPLFGTQYSGAV